MKDNQREDILTAYIAGLIDGEGTIRITKSKESWGNKYQVDISFVNTHRKAVEIVSRFLKAKTIMAHYPGQNGFKGKRICWKTKISGTVKVIEPLTKLLPYLEIKKEGAQLALEFLEKRSKYHPTRVKKGTHILSSDELEWREKMYRKNLDILHPQRLTEETLERVK